MSARARRGFTLIEMIAVILLTALVFTVAIDFYLDLSNASNAAVESTREVRRSAALLDRVAADLEAAVLVRKPEELDPLEHPWVFFAEAGNDGGSDRLRFVRRGRKPRTDAPESDLETVVWMVTEGFDGALELRRWSAPHLPDRLERSFPRVDETAVVAEDLSSFAFRFRDEEGAWLERWDSSTIAQSSQLPVEVEISLAFALEDPTLEPTARIRRVVLPLRPIDLEAQLGADGSADADEDGDDEETDEDDTAGNCSAGKTVAQCLSAHPELAQLVPEDMEGVFGFDPNQCVVTFQNTAFYPAIPQDCKQ